MIEISNGFTYEAFNFPCGERHIRLKNVIHGAVITVKFEFEKSEDIMDLLLIADALKRIGSPIVTLHIPYVPFSRQDRVAVPGECFSLRVFADLINSIGAKEVVVTDPHSDVTTALINNCKVITQADVFAPLLREKENYWLISPDGGALKKIYKLAEHLSLADGVIECSKARNPITGEITGVLVHQDYLEELDCVIVDDICDGGRTFVEIAKALKIRTTGKIILCVTHGFFTKGLSVFDGLIDEIYTLKGKVK